MQWIETLGASHSSSCSRSLFLTGTTHSCVAQPSMHSSGAKIRIGFAGLLSDCCFQIAVLRIERHTHHKAFPLHKASLVPALVVKFVRKTGCGML